MNFILHNLRLAELVAIVQGPSDARAAATIHRYLERKSEVNLYDGVLRPYTNGSSF